MSYMPTEDELALIRDAMSAARNRIYTYLEGGIQLDGMNYLERRFVETAMRMIVENRDVDPRYFPGDIEATIENFQELLNAMVSEVRIKQYQQEMRIIRNGGTLYS